MLTLGFGNVGARDSFDNGGSAEIVRQAAIDVVGHDWRVETIVDPGADPEAAPPPARTPAPQPRPPTARPASAAAARRPTEPPPARPSRRRPPRARSATARQAIAPDPHGRRAPATTRPRRPTPTAAPAPTTPTPSPPALDGAQLLQEALGAQVIDEIPHQ